MKTTDLDPGWAFETLVTREPAGAGEFRVRVNDYVLGFMLSQPEIDNRTDEESEGDVIYGVAKWDGCYHIYADSPQYGAYHTCGGPFALTDALQWVEEQRVSLLTETANMVLTYA